MNKKIAVNSPLLPSCNVVVNLRSYNTACRASQAREQRIENGRIAPSEFLSVATHCSDTTKGPTKQKTLCYCPSFSESVSYICYGASYRWSLAPYK